MTYPDKYEGLDNLPNFVECGGTGGTQIQFVAIATFDDALNGANCSG